MDGFTLILNRFLNVAGFFRARHHRVQEDLQPDPNMLLKTSATPRAQASNAIELLLDPLPCFLPSAATQNAQSTVNDAFGTGPERLEL